MSEVKTPKLLSDKPPFTYLVTLAYGDPDSPILATVVFVSEQSGEEPKTVAEALLTNAKNTSTQSPYFQWSTLKRQGNKAFSTEELAMLIEAAGRGRVGVARATPLKLN